MNCQEKYNSERYLDMTCFLALRNIERNEGKERRNRMKENWIYRRGDVYLANLDPYIGSEQGGTRPVVVLQNNTGNYYCPTLIVAPITSKAGKKPSQPTHYYAERIHGLEFPGMVLLEQIKTIDKRRVRKYLGRMTRQQEVYATIDKSYEDMKDSKRVTEDSALVSLRYTARNMVETCDVLFTNFPGLLEKPDYKDQVIEIMQEPKQYILKLEGETDNEQH